MKTREINSSQRIPPGEPDENWWAAVLSDEPQSDFSIEQTGSAVISEPSTEEVTKSTVNWERIKTIYTNDQIVNLNVVGFNRGGILVAGDDIHGFVPASHLIDVPADLSDDDRETYFTSYLDRNISLKSSNVSPKKSGLCSLKGQLWQVRVAGESYCTA